MSPLKRFTIALAEPNNTSVDYAFNLNCSLRPHSLHLLTLSGMLWKCFGVASSRALEVHALKP